MIKIKHIIISIIIVLVIIFHNYIYIGLWLGTAYIEKFYNDMKSNMIESNAREENSKVAENWIKETYGDIVADVIDIKYSGKGSGWSSGSVFDLESPFADGMLLVESDKNYKVSGGLNIQDSKFQHLYSEWVKKQVGIEDENVELKFRRAMYGARAIGDDIYIDFSRVTDLDNLEEQICQNTHNLYIISNSSTTEPGVIIYTSENENINELLRISDKIERQIRSKIYIYNNKNDNSFNKGNNLVIDIISNNNDNSHILRIIYNYDDNSKKYKDYYHNRDWQKYVNKDNTNSDNKYPQELLHFAGGYPDWTHKYHHAGFDITANRVMEIVNDYYHEVYEHFDDDINAYDEIKGTGYIIL